MIEWTANNNRFNNRRDCLLYCQENGIDLGEAEVAVSTLPETITYTKNTNLYESSKHMIQEFKNSGKKIILLYSGGPDSTLALNCFLKNGVSPDKIIVYTVDCFNGKSPYNSYMIETEQAKEYLYLLKNNGMLSQHTEIKEIFLDEKYFEEIYKDSSWPKFLYGMKFSIASASSLFHAPQTDISNSIVIRGGSTPGIYKKNDKVFAYFHDTQFGEAINGPDYNKSIDFNVYDKTFFSAYVSSLIDNVGEFISPSKAKGKNFTKFNIPEIKEMITIAPSCMPKDAPITMKLKDINNLFFEANITRMKEWVMYLEALRLKPKWFDYYQSGIEQNLDWVHFYNQCAGISTKNIPVEFR